MTADVVVAGAGAGGLACAHALGALGLRVLVLDRQRAPASIAKGEILQPETVRILDSWGALDALRATGRARSGGWPSATRTASRCSAWTTRACPGRTGRSSAPTTATCARC